MKKVVKTIGYATLCVTFDKEDKKIYDISDGDIIDFEIVTIKKVPKPKLTTR
jgi:hypothetical protein